MEEVQAALEVRNSGPNIYGWLGKPLVSTDERAHSLSQATSP
jgi:hypothetical protein